MSSERRDEAFIGEAATTPARYDEGTLATDQHTATGGRGYHNITSNVLQRVSLKYFSPCEEASEYVSLTR